MDDGTKSTDSIFKKEKYEIDPVNIRSGVNTFLSKFFNNDQI